MMKRASTLLVLLILPLSLQAESLAITNVQASPRVVDLDKHSSVSIRFSLNATADVTARIYDGRDLLVRELIRTNLGAGDHSITWDGRDAADRAVPPEAYVYTLTAQRGSDSIVFDLSEATGGQDVVPREVRWDADAGVLKYILDAPARVNVRAGLKDSGPLLGTVINWVARPAGLNQERWDGRDASSVLDLARHPGLEVFAQAFALPENSILVGPPQSTVQVTDSLPWGQEYRPTDASPKKRMHAHAHQPLEVRGDITVRLVLPPGLQPGPAGIPRVDGDVIPVRLEIDERDRERVLATRFETVFFVDGQFAFENEIGFAPMTWRWDVSSLNPGEHVLTVNVRGYEGNFGIASIKVLK